MSDSRHVCALKARYVFPVSAPPIAGGCVTIGGERITSVGAPPQGCELRDLGNVAIVPGLVNAHTHLEFSDLAAPLGHPGMPLPDWIRLVMASRRSQPDPTASVARGLAESLSSGTTTLGEIASGDWRSSHRGDAPLADIVMFHESIAPVENRVDAARATAEAFLARDVAQDQIRPALSPHAPYTVHRRLLESLVALARRFDVPLAMHLAESREEIELIRSGTGPLGDMLAEFNAWDPSPTARCASVLEYLDRLAAAPRALVIHGNYLDDGELAFLADHRATMAVVYCPRTHAFFRHEPYPLARMLELGVHMALGTDSRASNPDLSLLAEMKFVAHNHRNVPAATVLELGTLAGARALGIEEQTGTLEPGKLANLAVIQLEGGDGPDPHALLLAPEARVVRTFLRGKEIPTAGSS